MSKQEKNMSFRKVTLSVGIILAALAAGIYYSSIVAAHASSNHFIAASDTPDISELDEGKSEMRPVIERYIADRGSLSRSYPLESSPSRQARFKQFYGDWLALIGKMNFDAMSHEGKVDHILFRNHVERELKQLELQAKALAEIAPLLPFGQAIIDLVEARRRMEKVDPQKTAAQLNDLTKQVEATRRSLEADLRSEPGKVKKSVANRAVSASNSLRGALRAWFGYYNGYDPVFTWWMDEPYKSLDQSIGAYANWLTER